MKRSHRNKRNQVTVNDDVFEFYNFFCFVFCKPFGLVCLFCFSLVVLDRVQPVFPVHIFTTINPLSRITDLDLSEFGYDLWALRCSEK